MFVGKISVKCNAFYGRVNATLPRDKRSAVMYRKARPWIKSHWNNAHWRRSELGFGRNSCGTGITTPTGYDVNVAKHIASQPVCLCNCWKSNLKHPART
jgi:hypothetical protein